jgi:hypothetical protein
MVRITTLSSKNRYSALVSRKKGYIGVGLNEILLSIIGTILAACIQHMNRAPCYQRCFSIHCSRHLISQSCCSSQNPMKCTDSTLRGPDNMGKRNYYIRSLLHVDRYPASGYDRLKYSNSKRGLCMSRGFRFIKLR